MEYSILNLPLYFLFRISYHVQFFNFNANVEKRPARHD